MTGPRVSVLMSVRDAAPYLADALRSILGQSLRELELLVVDDGSTDGSAEVLARCHDPRLRVVPRRGEGLAAALQQLIEEAAAPLMARMDADDVCAPDRIRQQVRAMTADPTLALCGTSAWELDEHGRRLRDLPLLSTDAALRQQLATRNPFVHGSVVARRDLVLACGGYDASDFPAEDYALWVRLADRGSMHNVPELLYGYRKHAGSVSERGAREQQAATVRVRNMLWQGRPPRPATCKQLTAERRAWDVRPAEHRSALHRQLAADARRYAVEAMRHRRPALALRAGARLLGC